jgi:hypothetical protein
MSKGLTFLLVLILTTLAWILLGFVLRMFFWALSLWVFLFIGLGAGLLLGTLLAFMHEDTLPVAAPDGEFGAPDSSRQPASPAEGRSDLPGTPPHPQA